MTEYSLSSESEIKAIIRQIDEQISDIVSREKELSELALPGELSEDGVFLRNEYGNLIQHQQQVKQQLYDLLKLLGK